MCLLSFHLKDSMVTTYFSGYFPTFNRKTNYQNPTLLWKLDHAAHEFIEKKINTSEMHFCFAIGDISPKHHMILEVECFYFWAVVKGMPS